MWRTPQRLLMSYAGVVVALGLVLAMLDGFADGWRIVGANVALLAASCAVIAKLAADHNRRSIAGAVVWAGIVLAALSAFNFLRLSIKWHEVQQVLSPASLAAALMGVAGLVTAVLLWRLVIAASHRSWTWHVRRLGTAAGVLAMGAGFIMTKAATLPQSASAMVQSAITSSDLAARLTDSALGDKLVESALRSKAVTNELRKQGLRDEQIERLADDPQLRSAAFDVLRGAADGQGDVDLSSLAAAIDSHTGIDVAAIGAEKTTVAAHADALRDIAGTMSRQELLQLSRSLNVSADDLGINASTAAGMSIDDVDRHINDARVRELLQQQPDTTADSRDIQTTLGDTTTIHLTTGAARVKADRINSRVEPERYDHSSTAQSSAPDSASLDAAATATSYAQRAATPIALGLIDQAALASSGKSQSFTDDVSADQPSTAGVPHATVAIHTADRGVSPADVAAVAEVIRSKMLQEATLPAGDLPEKSHWRLTPGFSLSRMGVVVLIIGGAIILCCIALGRSEKSAQVQPAV